MRRSAVKRTNQSGSELDDWLLAEEDILRAAEQPSARCEGRERLSYLAHRGTQRSRPLAHYSLTDLHSPWLGGSAAVPGRWRRL